MASRIVDVAVVSVFEYRIKVMNSPGGMKAGRRIHQQVTRMLNKFMAPKSYGNIYVKSNGSEEMPDSSLRADRLRIVPMGN